MNKPNTKPTSIRIDPAIMQKLRKIAVSEKRSINNLINYILDKYVSK